LSNFHARRVHQRGVEEDALEISNFGNGFGHDASPVSAQTPQSHYDQPVKILAVVFLGLLLMSGCASHPSIEEESRAAYEQDQQNARIDEFARSLHPPQ
jgi:hypothetical protein